MLEVECEDPLLSLIPRLSCNGYAGSVECSFLGVEGLFEQSADAELWMVAAVRRDLRFIGRNVGLGGSTIALINNGRRTTDRCLDLTSLDHDDDSARHLRPTPRASIRITAQIATIKRAMYTHRLLKPNIFCSC